MSRTIVFIGLILSACAGSRFASLPPATESLTPQISQDGTKFFVFQRHYLNPPADPGRTPPQRRAEPGSVEFSEESLQQRLMNVLQQTGYCHGGYFERYRDNGRESFSLRGECREMATPEDRQRFRGDPIPIQ